MRIGLSARLHLANSGAGYWHYSSAESRPYWWAITDASILRLRRHRFLQRDALVFAIREVRHVRRNGGLVADLNRRVSLLIARTDALHPVGHVVLALRLSGYGRAASAIRFLRIVVDASLVFACHHVGCAGDVFNG